MLTARRLKEYFRGPFFRGVQIAMGDNLQKIEENILIFHDFLWVFHTLKANYVNKYGLI